MAQKLIWITLFALSQNEIVFNQFLKCCIAFKIYGCRKSTFLEKLDVKTYSFSLIENSNYPETEVEGNYPLGPYTNHAGRGAGIGF